MLNSSTQISQLLTNTSTPPPKKNKKQKQNRNVRCHKYIPSTSKERIAYWFRNAHSRGGFNLSSPPPNPPKKKRSRQQTVEYQLGPKT